MITAIVVLSDNTVIRIEGPIMIYPILLSGSNSDLTNSDLANSLIRIEGPILIYYYIDNFHQNHRGYEDDR